MSPKNMTSIHPEKSWSLKAPVLGLRRAMDQFFEDWFEDLEMKLPQTLIEGRELYTPTLDLIETEKEIQVTAELPGMDEKDIQLSISKDFLTLKGEKKEKKEEKGKNFYRKERSFGCFERSIRLPMEVQSDKVKATFKKGVLTIALPKSSKVRKIGHSIQIKTE